jgi:hypothetical protein
MRASAFVYESKGLLALTAFISYQAVAASSHGSGSRSYSNT